MPTMYTYTHMTLIIYLFNCSQVLTQHNTTSQWKKPLEAAEVIQEWESRLASRYLWRKGNNNNTYQFKT